jgi:hypothetical protein
VAIGLSGGFAHGRLRNRTAGYDNLYDWSAGTQLAYTIESTKLSFGTAYRGSNAYLLDVVQVLGDSRSRMVQVSTAIERPMWLVGAEFSFANVDGPVNYEIKGFQVSAGYKVNANMQLSIGWQHYNYSRNVGAFYNGLPEIGMDGAFLALSYTL